MSQDHRLAAEMEAILKTRPGFASTLGKVHEEIIKKRSARGTKATGLTAHKVRLVAKDAMYGDLFELPGHGRIRLKKLSR